MLKRKIVVPETKVLDVSKGRVQAVVSTEAKDRDGDIIRVEGWQLDNFMQHPVLLSSHDYHSLRNVIGEWESMESKVKPARLEGVARYYIGEGNEEADWAFNLAQKGRAAYSVGFIPDPEKAVEMEGGRGWFPAYEYNGQELLEVSQVAIPSNPEALQKLHALLKTPGQGDADLLALVEGELRDHEPPKQSVDYRRLISVAFGKAYLEVYPW